MQVLPIDCYRYRYRTLTLAKSMYIGAEIILSFLAIDQLSQTIHIAIALLVAIVRLVRQIHLHATLHSLGYAVRDDTLCEWRNQKREREMN